MEKKEILSPKAKIPGGITLSHKKNTAESETVRISPVKTVILPLVQHIGAPCEPLKKVGDRVYIGTKIADSDKPVCAPIFSSVSGTVKKIDMVTTANGNKCKAIFIENDFSDEKDPDLKPFIVKNKDDLVKAARECGLVGLGGAGFPTHIKLNISKEKPADTLIINAAECEPYITTDYRECMENPKDVLEGIYFVKEMLGIKNCIIAVEDNKPKAIKLFYDIASNVRDVNNEIKLLKLKSRYPQGAEKVLIYTALKRKVTTNKLPLDVGVIVMNVTSVAVLHRFIKTGMPLVEKRVTVDGNAVKKPQNVMCPIGTPIIDILNFAQCEDYDKVLFGGPMMGGAIEDVNAPLIKQNNAILAFKGSLAKPNEETPCIRCAKCEGVCPMRLRPREIAFAVEHNEGADVLKSLNASTCMECGCCTYICPASRKLTQRIHTAKQIIRKAGNK